MTDFLLHMMTWPRNPVYKISDIAPVRGAVANFTKVTVTSLPPCRYVL